MQKRVKFDFEIDFVNGGGLQGYSFRLDIPSGTNTDENLIAYILAYLRLLTVKRVRIWNMEILEDAAHPLYALDVPFASTTGDSNIPLGWFTELLGNLN